jgi:hypothetical protein
MTRYVNRMGWHAGERKDPAVACGRCANVCKCAQKGNFGGSAANFRASLAHSRRNGGISVEFELICSIELEADRLLKNDPPTRLGTLLARSRQVWHRSPLLSVIKELRNSAVFTISLEGLTGDQEHCGSGKET